VRGVASIPSRARYPTRTYAGTLAPTTNTRGGAFLRANEQARRFANCRRIPEHRPPPCPGHGFSLVRPCPGFYCLAPPLLSIIQPTKVYPSLARPHPDRAEGMRCLSLLPPVLWEGERGLCSEGLGRSGRSYLLKEPLVAFSSSFCLPLLAYFS
jgi:hypothetical protein